MKIPLTMDDGPNSAPHNGQLGASTSVGATSSSSVKTNNNEDNNPRTQYSIPGILHYIQHEWARFEMERSQWDVERAELQVYFDFPSPFQTLTRVGRAFRYFNAIVFLNRRLRRRCSPLTPTVERFLTRCTRTRFRLSVTFVFSVY